MTTYYSRQGAVIFICDNVRLKVKREKLLAYGFLFCEGDLQALMINPKEAISLYANYKAIKKAFETTSKVLTLQQLRIATHNTLSDMELLKNANLALMLGIKENLIAELFENALKLGYAIGLKSQKAIESLSKGLARQSRLILDNIGISFRAETANNWFKKEQGFEKLNSEQKKQAWKSYAIELIKVKAEHLGIPKEKASQDQLQAKIRNQKTEYGKDLSY